jgi:hypothetical protein
MGAHTAGPEDAEKQENGADNLTDPTHSPKAIPVPAALARSDLTGLRLSPVSSCCRGLELCFPSAALCLSAEAGIE